jgi:hypothetical protein
MSMYSETGIRTVAANSMLRRHRSVVLRLTDRGYELTSEGEEPVVCESWPRAKRVLRRLGLSDAKMNEIMINLCAGKEIVVRTRG